MIKNILLTIIITFIPIIVQGKGHNKNKINQSASIEYLTDDDSTVDEDNILSNYYPGNNGLNNGKRSSRSQTGLNMWELRIEGSLSKGIGGTSDTNANYHIGGNYHYNQRIAFGAATGLYYSVGPCATHSVPIIGTVDYKIAEIKDFTPFIEGYGGYLIGIKNTTMQCCAPSCGIYGAKAGITYKFTKKLDISISINYFNITQSSNEKHCNTAESCVGPSGYIGYRF